jgi:hypothetical protein
MELKIRIDDASFEAMFAIYLRWAQLGVKLSEEGPKLRHFWTWLGLPCASHGPAFMQGHLANIGPVLGPTSAPHNQDAPCWAAVGLKLGTSSSSAQVMPKLRPSGLLFGPT